MRGSRTQVSCISLRRKGGKGEKKEKKKRKSKAEGTGYSLSAVKSRRIGTHASEWGGEKWEKVRGNGGNKNPFSSWTAYFIPSSA